MKFRTLAYGLFLLSRGVIPASAAERLHVVDAGTGSPIVLIPGLASSGYGYRKVTAQLQEHGFRTVIVEPLGTGNSSRPAGADYSFTAQAGRVARELDARGVKRAVFVVQGSCASIVFRLALARPEMVAGVVSLEGGAPEEVATPGLRRAARFSPLIRLFGSEKKVRTAMRDGLEKASGNPSWVTEEAVDAYAGGAADDLDTTLRVVEAMVRAREPEPLRPRLGEIQCPVELLLGGAPHEGGLSDEEVRLLRDSLTRIRVYPVPGAGHFLGEERPAAVTASVSRLVRSAADALSANSTGSGTTDPRR
jgi:haloalkane dehalogenase